MNKKIPIGKNIDPNLFFCSKECKQSSDKKQNDLSKKVLKNLKHPITLKCKYCQEEFFTRKKEKQYCNKHISKKHQKRKKSKHKKTKLYFSDLYYYDFDNYDGNRIWCLLRDDFTCTQCGNEENLTIHHKDGKGFSKKPQHRNNNLNNLITLCNRCHDEIESPNLKIENYIASNKIKKHYNFSIK